jgi:hypothetical protein
MTELGLNPSELIAFAVIHHYTAYQGGYAGGALALSKWCGIAKSKIYRVLDKLIEKEYVVKLKASKGRGTSVYASIVNCPQTGQLEGTKGDSCLSPNGTVNCPQTGHYIDNRYIDTPYSPPTRGTANAGAKPGERKRHRGASKNRALNYLKGSYNYSDEELRKLGISMGEEFYEDEATEAALGEIRT